MSSNSSDYECTSAVASTCGIYCPPGADYCVIPRNCAKYSTTPSTPANNPSYRPRPRPIASTRPIVDTMPSWARPTTYGPSLGETPIRTFSECEPAFNACRANGGGPPMCDTQGAIYTDRCAFEMYQCQYGPRTPTPCNASQLSQV